MNKLREITLFTVGDAHQLSTWSNVPFLFSKELEAQGVTVNYVNIEEDRFWNSFYKYSIFVFLKILAKDTRHTYFRSGLNSFFTKRKIKQADKLYTNSQVNIFLTFSFSSVDVSKKPCVLFGDWTYLYFIKNFLGREPKWFEKNALERESRNINSSQLVLALFPLSAAFIKSNFDQKNTHYFGNVINAVQEPKKEYILDHKLRFKKIIFIGNKKYLSGAKQLIEAFCLLDVEDAELHIVGLTNEDTGYNFKNIHHYGYLDKGNKTHKEKYYQLLSECALIVNTNEGWGAISAVIEAMYFYTAVITTPYSEFTETFGKEINFGAYSNTNSKEQLAKLIHEILDQQPQTKMRTLENSHSAVKDQTWKVFTEKVIAQTESLL